MLSGLQQATGGLLVIFWLLLTQPLAAGTPPWVTGTPRNPGTPGCPCLVPAGPALRSRWQKGMGQEWEPKGAPGVAPARVCPSGGKKTQGAISY